MNNLFERPIRYYLIILSMLLSASCIKGMGLCFVKKQGWTPEQTIAYKKVEEFSVGENKITSKEVQDLFEKTTGQKKKIITVVANSLDALEKEPGLYNDNPPLLVVVPKLLEQWTKGLSTGEIRDIFFACCLHEFGHLNGKHSNTKDNTYNRTCEKEADIFFLKNADKIPSSSRAKAIQNWITFLKRLHIEEIVYAYNNSAHVDQDAKKLVSKIVETSKSRDKEEIVHAIKTIKNKSDAQTRFLCAYILASKELIEKKESPEKLFDGPSFMQNLILYLTPTHPTAIMRIKLAQKYLN
ncbi:MAG: hypothetical protein JW725_04220 [Candidatus Babeliaceae bacterium]|nr:hypothetical protein [Candidatus Babeliaceae bacterium]